MTVWRGLDIGSAKPTLEERRRVPHHLIDVLEIDQPINLGLFLEMAERSEQQIRERGKVLIACGGTIYYLKHYLFGAPSTPPIDWEIRTYVNNLEQELGPSGLWDLLLTKDPISAQRIHPNDLYRIKRALEVFFQTGTPLSRFSTKKYPMPRFPVIILDIDKEVLERRIHSRCDEMFRLGWVEEVEGLLDKGFSPTSPGLQSLGYAEITRDLIQGRNPRESQQEIIRKTIQLAKKQLTFLRGIQPAYWVPPRREEVLAALEEATRGL